MTSMYRTRQISGAPPPGWSLPPGWGQPLDDPPLGDRTIRTIRTRFELLGSELLGRHGCGVLWRSFALNRIKNYFALSVLAGVRLIT